MKKHLLLLVAILALSGASKGQFTYFYNWSYMTPTYSLSNGIATSYTPGFTWFGYEPALQPGIYPWSYISQNFIIHNAGANTQWMSYKVYESDFASCTGALTQVMNGHGITGIEPLGVNGVRFAVAGAYNKGCYFVTVNPLLQPVSSRLYRFPAAADQNKPAPTKPIIVHEPLSGDYFIAGGYNGEIYALRVDANGNIIWSKYYRHMGISFPTDILYSPYGDNRLIIVGIVETSSNNSDGFLMEVDGSLGNIIQTRILGEPLKNEEINTVIAGSAVGSGNGQGYILAGSEKRLGGAKQAWLTKLDVLGNTLWSNLINPNSGSNMGFVDILERLNTFNSYEYYGLLKSSAGMVVVKLNAMGQPYPLSSSVVSNEFIFNLPGVSPTVPSSISKVDGPSGTLFQGIQVYGTASNSPPVKTTCMFSAYFNGENCARTLLVQDLHEPGPLMNENSNVSSFPGMNACTNFTVFPIQQGYAINYPCSGLFATGSNERQGSYTTINKDQNSESGVYVFPNPVHDKLYVIYSANENEQVLVKVTNLLGQEVLSQSVHANKSGEQTAVLDLSASSLPGGVYFVTTIVSGHKYEQKIIYAH